MSFLDRLSEAESKLTHNLPLHELVEHTPLISKIGEKLGLNDKPNDASVKSLPPVNLVEQGCVTPPNWNNDGTAEPRGGGKDKHDHNHPHSDSKDEQQIPSVDAKPEGTPEKPTAESERRSTEERKPSESVPAERLQKPDQIMVPQERIPSVKVEQQPAQEKNESRPDRIPELQNTETGKSERQKYVSAVERMIPSMTESLPVKKGEGYYQVLSRMFPGMKENDLSTLAHDAEKLNGNKVLHTGQKFQILSDYGKKLLTDRIVADYDNKQDGAQEHKKRERFNPAYEQVLSKFAKSIGMSAEHATKLAQADHKTDRRSDQRVEKNPETKKPDTNQTEEAKEQVGKDNTEKDSTKKEETKDNTREAAEKTEQQNREVYESLKDFVAACAELKKQGEMLQFLGKWYTPETHMYAYGMEKYADALEHVQESSARLKASMTDQREREQLHTQWRDFMLKQQRAMAEFRRNLPILGEAYRQRFESQDLLQTI